MIDLRPWLRLIRIPDFSHFLGLILLGAFYRPTGEMPWSAFAVALVAGFFYLAHAYGLNNLCDVDIDRDGHLAAKNPVANGELSAHAGNRFVALLAAVTLAFCTLLTRRHLECMAVMIVASFLYSSRTFRLKAVPVLGTLINVLLFIPLFFFGVFLTRTEWSGPLAAVGGFLAFSVVIPQLFHEIEDFNEDRRGRVATLRVKTSRGVSHLLIAVLAIGQGAVGFLLFYKGLLPFTAACAAAGLAGAQLAVIMVARLGARSAGAHRLHRLAARYLNVLFGLALLLSFIKYD